MSLKDNQKSLKKIIEKYVAGNASEAEIAFLELYYQSFDKNENAPETNAEIEEMQVAGLASIQEKIANSPKKRKISIYRYGAVAAILALLIGSVFLIWNKKNTNSANNLVKINNKVDALPGSDKAILTLANGKKIVLDGKSNENISEDAILKISKTKNGQLIYTVNAQHLTENKQPDINTIETPRAGQYQVVLPDGTKVWLNAASSLTFPEFFVGNTRKVKLIGEAYFEVAKNKNSPFLVESDLQTVKVLGTHFNINAYKDDLVIKTTLLEGSVEVSNQKSNQILKPGEQAVVTENASIKINKSIDTDDELAWKNGQFRFNNASLKSILKQLERWYDIKVDYNTLPNKRFNGMVARKSNLSQVFNMLEKTGNIKFDIEKNGTVKVITL